MSDDSKPNKAQYGPILIFILSCFLLSVGVGLEYGRTGPALIVFGSMLFLSSVIDTIIGALKK